MQCHGLQCGFCTPGMLMTARWLLDHDPDPERGHDPRGDLGPVLPLHRLREHRARRSAGRPSTPRARPRRGGDGMTADRRSAATERPASARPATPSASAACCARRTPASCGARATTSTTSSCRACSTARSCAARSPTPASSRSTPRRPRPTPRSRPSSPVPRSRASGWRGCRRCRTTSRPCWPPTRCGSRARRWRSSSPRTATRPATPSSSSTSTTSRSTRSSTPAGRSTTDAPGHPRRPRGQGRQPHLRLGVRRRGAVRRGVRRRRRRGQPGHPLPALAPGAAGDVRLGGPHGQGHRQAHGLDHQPGPARPPHGLRAGGRAARAQDPGDLARHRRRLRQQGADLPRLRAGGGRLDRHRQAGQVGGGPVREPDVHRIRPRLPHARRDRRHPRGQDPRAAGRRHRRPRRLQRQRQPDQVPGRVLQHLHRQLRPAGGALQGHRRLHQQGAGRRGLRLLVPHHRGRLPGRADRRRPRRRAGHGPGRAADEEPAAPRAVPLPHQDRVGVRLGRLPAGAAARPRHGRLRRAAPRAGREAGAGRADGHRAQLLHRGRGRRAPQAHGHPRPRHGRRLRAAGPPDRQGRGAPQRADAGPGPRDDLRPDRVQPARHPTRGHRGRPRRHRPDAVRARHLRLALDAGVGCGRRRGGAAGARQGPDRGRRRARVLARRPRVGARPLVREGRPDPGQDDPGDRPAGPQQPRAARGGRGPPRRLRRLQPAEPHLPVRRLPVRRRRRPGHGAGAGAPVRGGGRLRPAHQPDDRRGPDPRWPGRRRGHGAHAGHRLRRGRQLPRRLVHGLPAADRDGVPHVGAGRDGDPVAPPPARVQGRGRVGHGGLARRRWSTPSSTPSSRSASATPTCR